jgi:hypothetical protein
MTLTIRWPVLGAAAKVAWPAWVTALGVVGAAVLAAAIGWLCSAGPEDVVQYAGFILDVLGISTVWYGLTESRRRFKRPSLRASISKWFGLVAGAFGQRRNQAFLEASLSMSGSLSAVLTKGSRAPVTVEERLIALEQGVRELKAETTAAAEGLRQDVSTLRRELQQERNEREAGDKRAWQEIEDLAVGGFPLQAVGLFWTVAGILLTSPIGQWAGRLLTR